MKKEYNLFVIFHGFFLGFLLILTTTFFYINNSEYLLPGVNLFSISFLVVLILYSSFSLSIFKSKKNQHNYDFKIFFSICFLILLVGSFLVKMYILLLYYFDNKLILEYLNHTYVMHDALGQGYSMEDWKGVILPQFSFLKQMQSYVFTLIPCTLYSAIISLLIKIIF